MILMVKKMFCKNCGEEHPVITKVWGRCLTTYPEKFVTSTRYYCSNCFKFIKEVEVEDDKQAD